MLIDCRKRDISFVQRDSLPEDPVVTIRAIEMDDMPLIVKWRNTPEIYECFYEHEPLSLSQQTEWFKRLVTNEKEKLWMICNLSKPVGTVGLINIDWRSRKCEWGRFFIGETSSRGSGIGFITEKIILDYVFNHMNMNKLYCEVLVWNEKVIEMHKKFGFQEEGLFREHVYKEGRYQDVVRLSLLASEYKR